MNELLLLALGRAIIVKEFIQLRARPPDLRHDHRHPGAAAHPVRLRDQLRPEAAADRGARRRSGPYSRSVARRACRPAATSASSDSVRERGRAGERCWRRATCSSPSPSRRTSAASWCAASARCCWSRPTPPTRRPSATPSPRSRNCRLPSLQRDLSGALTDLKPAAAAGRGARAPALQPGRRHRLQHRARPDRHHPHHDHGADDRPRHDARARARHVREPARHAGAADRGDDRQDRALHRDRPDPGGADHRRGAACCSRCRCRAARCCSISWC